MSREGKQARHQEYSMSEKKDTYISCKVLSSYDGSLLQTLGQVYQKFCPVSSPGNRSDLSEEKEDPGFACCGADPNEWAAEVKSRDCLTSKEASEEPLLT
ncbi:hypothetical protein U0070_019309 [Myodes glareolus]|uniref:Uncharacterized protein n=1 Tax=Myodes glareolus TaxID=447135 RepID=A0AAW0I7D6_MYOGA